MNLPQIAAGRPRSASDRRAFSTATVGKITQIEATPNPLSSPYAWKRALEERIWAPEGPKGVNARAVLAVLVRHADANGRCWMSARTIAAKVGVYNARTVRAAVDELARGGWLHTAAKTWAELAAEQRAAGRPIPRRGDVGQAPNLYTVRDGHGGPVTPEAQPQPTTTGPGIVRIVPAAQGSLAADVQMDDCTSTSPPVDDALERVASSAPEVSEGGQGPMSPRGQGPMSPTPPRAEEPPDLSPSGSRSRKVSDGREPRPEQGTHRSRKSSGENSSSAEAWDVIADAHAEQAERVYGLRPLPTDLSREQRQAMAECLAGAAMEITAKLRARTGLERELAEVRRELAERVMRLYFKRKNSHLTQVRHALRDLYRELHARMTEAMEALLRATHDAAPSRKPRFEPATPEARVERARAAAEVEKLCGLVAPPGERRRVDVDELEGAGLGAMAFEEVVGSAEGDDEAALEDVEPERVELAAADVDPYKRPFVHSIRGPRPTINGPTLVPALNTAELPTPEASRDVGRQPAPIRATPEVRTWNPFRPASPREAEALGQLRAALGPELVPEAAEAPPEDDGPAFVQRPLGRSGAPRWGDVGPRPAKVRLVARPLLEEPEEERLGGSTPPE